MKIDKETIAGFIGLALPIILIGLWWFSPSLKGIVKKWIAISIGLSAIGTVIAILGGLGLLILAGTGYIIRHRDRKQTRGIK